MCSGSRSKMMRLLRSSALAIIVLILIPSCCHALSIYSSKTLSYSILEVEPPFYPENISVKTDSGDNIVFSVDFNINCSGGEKIKAKNYLNLSGLGGVNSLNIGENDVTKSLSEGAMNEKSVFKEIVPSCGQKWSVNGNITKKSGQKYFLKVGSGSTTIVFQETVTYKVNTTLAYVEMNESDPVSYGGGHYDTFRDPVSGKDLMRTAADYGWNHVDSGSGNVFGRTPTQEMFRGVLFSGKNMVRIEYNTSFNSRIAHANYTLWNGYLRTEWNAPGTVAKVRFLDSLDSTSIVPSERYYPVNNTFKNTEDSSGFLDQSWFLYRETDANTYYCSVFNDWQVRDLEHFYVDSTFTMIGQDPGLRFGYMNSTVSRTIYPIPQSGNTATQDCQECQRLYYKTYSPVTVTTNNSFNLVMNCSGNGGDCTEQYDIVLVSNVTNITSLYLGDASRVSEQYWWEDHGKVWLLPPETIANTSQLVLWLNTHPDINTTASLNMTETTMVRGDSSDFRIKITNPYVDNVSYDMLCFDNRSNSICNATNFTMSFNVSNPVTIENGSTSFFEVHINSSSSLSNGTYAGNVTMRPTNGVGEVNVTITIHVSQNAGNVILTPASWVQSMVTTGSASKEFNIKNDPLASYPLSHCNMSATGVFSVHTSYNDSDIGPLAPGSLKTVKVTVSGLAVGGFTESLIVSCTADVEANNDTATSDLVFAVSSATVSPAGGGGGGGALLPASFKVRVKGTVYIPGLPVTISDCGIPGTETAYDFIILNDGSSSFIPKFGMTGDLNKVSFIEYDGKNIEPGKEASFKLVFLVNDTVLSGTEYKGIVTITGGNHIESITVEKWVADRTCSKGLLDILLFRDFWEQFNKVVYELESDTPGVSSLTLRAGHVSLLLAGLVFFKTKRLELATIMFIIVLFAGPELLAVA